MMSAADFLSLSASFNQRVTSWGLVFRTGPCSLIDHHFWLSFLPKHWKKRPSWHWHCSDKVRMRKTWSDRSFTDQRSSQGGPKKVRPYTYIFYVKLQHFIKKNIIKLKIISFYILFYQFSTLLNTMQWHLGKE